MTVLADGRVATPALTLIWAQLAQADDQGDRFIKVRIPKTDSVTISELETLLRTKAQADNVPFKTPFQPGDQWRDGDVIRNDDGKPVEAYLGHWVVKFKTKLSTVGVIDINNVSVDPTFEKDKFYSGAQVRACLHAYSYGQNAAHGNKGVNLGLDGVQLVSFDKTIHAPLFGEGGGTMSTSQLANAFGGGVSTQPAPAPQQTASAPNPNPAPAPDFLQPPAPAVKTLIQTGAHTIEALRAAGWGDDQMVAAGHAKWSA